MMVRTRSTCRLCGSAALTPVIDLGEQVLASAFATDDVKGDLPVRPVPLELVRCDPALDEAACGLVQLRHTFPAELIYADYWYESGISATMRAHLADVVAGVCELVGLSPGDTVVDIGCNDGTLLAAYGVEGLDLVGFDPAHTFVGSEPVPMTRVADFFSAAGFRSVRGDGQAKVVTSIAMFYDLEDPDAFTADVASILAPDGVWVVQMADLPTMLEHNMFDNICHEHLAYYSLEPLERLFSRHGLRLVDVELNDANYSSYRLYVRRADGPAATDAGAERLRSRRLAEFNLGLETDAPYDAFRTAVERIRDELTDLIRRLRSEGATVLVYGASTKGNVLLQYCGFTSEDLPYAAERNPRKWGGRTLGSDIPIISEDEARAMAPDYFLVLPYHFLPEMLEREREFVDRGGRFIVPVPEVRIVP